ncbi:MAG: TIGR03905 family TSCPD domain-containing protein [Oscillospiraceae bacterium]|nr:TIGR03905 family TSCPD domain-containing protein [Oscillospiraceae bacterium]
MVYRYKTKGTCTSEIEVEITKNTEKDGEIKIVRVEFIGGCGGNTQGVSKLVEGMSPGEAIAKLRGIRCGKKSTSCPDQLSFALEQACAQLEADASRPEYLKQYEDWLSYSGLDPKTRTELMQIGSDDEKIKDYFLAPLAFGTGGLRGHMRPGINSMNVYVVKQATQAIANLIKSEGEDFAKKGVVIAYDSRNNSECFAKEAAKTLAANGIKAYIFDDVRPTPELSFAIKHKGFAAGINITASHNPKQDNGYKAYWSDGGQFPPEHAKTVTAEIAKTKIFEDVKTSHYGEMIKQGNIELIGSEVDEAYLKEVLDCCLRPEVIGQADENFGVVYTPLHGAGHKLVPEALLRLGLKKLFVVEEQREPNGEFPTVKYPNPEYPQSYVLGIELAKDKDKNCGLVLATDPDCDRLGAAVKNANGDFELLTGNQTGALLLDYIIKARKESGKNKPNDCAITTIVTSDIATNICNKNEVELLKVLTGFKYIGEKINKFEKDGDHTFIFGYEESYGYLAGTYARDKDAVLAATLVVEMAAYYHKQGRNLLEVLQKLYKTYGYHRETTQDFEFAGPNGKNLMNDIMASIRKNPPTELAEYKVTKYIDYNDKTKNTELPEADVLEFALNNGSTVTIRPSGTEAKIKIYYLLLASGEEAAKTQEQKLKEAIGKTNPHLEK